MWYQPPPPPTGRGRDRGQGDDRKRIAFKLTRPPRQSLFTPNHIKNSQRDRHFCPHKWGGPTLVIMSKELVSVGSFNHRPARCTNMKWTHLSLHLTWSGEQPQTHRESKLVVLPQRQPLQSPTKVDVMYSGLYRTDQSKAKYKPESSTQKGRVNPPPWERRLTKPMLEKGRGEMYPSLIPLVRRIVLVVKSDKRRDRPRIMAKSRV